MDIPLFDEFQLPTCHPLVITHETASSSSSEPISFFTNKYFKFRVLQSIDWIVLLPYSTMNKSTTNSPSTLTDTAVLYHSIAASQAMELSLSFVLHKSICQFLSPYTFHKISNFLPFTISSYYVTSCSTIKFTSTCLIIHYLNFSTHYLLPKYTSTSILSLILFHFNILHHILLFSQHPFILSCLILSNNVPIPNIPLPHYIPLNHHIFFLSFRLYQLILLISTITDL